MAGCSSLSKILRTPEGCFHAGRSRSSPATIRSQGLIKPLSSCHCPNNRFEVRRGARRLRDDGGGWHGRAAGHRQHWFDVVSGIVVNVMREGLDPLDLADALTDVVSASAGTAGKSPGGSIALRLDCRTVWVSSRYRMNYGIIFVPWGK